MGRASSAGGGFSFFEPLAPPEISTASFPSSGTRPALGHVTADADIQPNTRAEDALQMMADVSEEALALHFGSSKDEGAACDDRGRVGVEYAICEDEAQGGRGGGMEA